MSEPKLISPMLDRFDMGDPISDHHGVRCCPAMEKDSSDKYIVKIISIPASQTQLDALLLTGAYPDEASALEYFKELANGVIEEVNTLKHLSQLEGFLPYENMQLVPMEEETGYDVYLLSAYKRTLARHFTRTPMTHLSAINLGLDLCAALTVCRRAGYLYADLKPSNVFVTTDNEFRIGDLGFIKLDSLKYASLPDKYRSKYTAPELSDAFTSLNSTIDVYALGLILYQAYNSGVLPFTDDAAPAEVFAPPAYADYEMAEIILKACAPDPADRWQDPIQMGQALVSYMQRNGVNDTPIVPPAAASEDAEVSENDETVDELQSETDVTAEPVQGASEETQNEPDTEETDSASDTGFAYLEDDLGNLSFLEDTFDDETAPENNESEIAYDEVSHEVSEILTQADELVSHPVPDPVVAPAPIEVPVPEPISVEETTEEATDFQEIGDEESQRNTQDQDPQNNDSEDAEDQVENTQSSEDAMQENDAPKKKKKTNSHWFRNTVLVLLLLGLIAGGFYYFTNYYLQSVESVNVEGIEDGLIVYVESNIDDSKLTVVCSDAYGNQIVAPVVDGKATFTRLVPDTGYNVNVRIDGFHKLTGNISTAYSTPVQTSIVQFGAVTGSEDGSAILGFTVDGPDSDQWKVIYTAAGEEEKSVTFPSHMVTLTGLTVGKEYTFKLVTDTQLYVTGSDELKFTASKLVFAKNLTVKSFVNNTLTASWSVPDDTDVENWTVRCYDDSEYNETIITSENTVAFQGLDPNSSYTLEVTAAGMSVSERVFIPKNAITVTDFWVDDSEPGMLILYWEANRPTPDDGWILHYTVNGSDTPESIACNNNYAVIDVTLDNADYLFILQEADGTPVLSDELTYPAGEE